MARPNRTSAVLVTVLAIGTLMMILWIWEESGWEEWAKSAAPLQLHGTYVSMPQQDDEHRPERVILESTQFRYRINTDGQPRWTRMMVCGGSSYRDGVRHIIWLSIPGVTECGSGHYARVRIQNDGTFTIEEYIEPVRVAGEDNYRQAWQGRYALQE